VITSKGLRPPPWLGYRTVTKHLCHKWPRICSIVNTFRSFPHSWLITGFVTRVTRRVPLVEQELIPHPQHLSSPLVFSGVRVTRSLVFCDKFCGSLFLIFLLAIVLSVLLRFTSYDYLFDILKLFLHILA
jgi:hypothetical protein